MTDTVDTLEAPPEVLAEAPAEPIVTEGYCDYMVVFADEDEAYSVLYELVPITHQQVRKDVEVTNYLIKGDADSNFEDYTTTTLQDGMEVLDSWPIVVGAIDPDAPTTMLIPKYKAIDMIGTIYEPAPDPVPENYKPLPYTGYHANVRNIGPAPELDAFVVSPSPVTPLRVWA
jgi:hypothetical protein